MDEKYIIPSVDQACRLLHLLSRMQHRNKTFGEICKLLQTPRTTCLRLLKTLVAQGLVHYDERTRRYNLGPYLVVLGARAAESLDYLEITKFAVTEVARKTGLTTVAAQRIRKDRLTYVVKEDSISNVHVTVSLGQQFPIDRGSFGKCFCAYMDDKELRDVAAERYGEVFISELDQIRRQGYALSYQEQVKGINGVAAPVFDSSGRVLLAIACIGIADQFPTDKMNECGERLKEIAMRVTREMGGYFPEVEELTERAERLP
ncbi:IclR family transcriptional regulator [Kyrpidia spormannii]|uniref:IclR family transcriptional regulator n=1 Tax=Kyrpidia spormannii TaxID=2055160 RepID=UPI001E3E54D9|nr:IclR family transcriptional regulator [Kyrpidia spormannii]